MTEWCCTALLLFLIRAYATTKFIEGGRCSLSSARFFVSINIQKHIYFMDIRVIVNQSKLQQDLLRRIRRISRSRQLLHDDRSHRKLQILLAAE